MTTFERTANAVLERVSGGASIAEAARTEGVGVSTVKGWLEKGRRDPHGAYGAFAAQVDEIRTGRALPPSDELRDMDENELRALVANAARKGNVAAMRLFADRFLAPVAAAEGKTEAARIIDLMLESAKRRTSA
jgi:transposase-like protein